MPRLVVLVGFPASGKSYKAEEMRAANPGIAVFNDPFTRNFFTGEGFKGIVRALEAGRDCVVCDVNFCHAANGTFLDRVMGAVVPGLVPEYQYFEANEANCRANIEGDFEASAKTEKDAMHRQRRLDALDQTKDHYVVPAGTAAHAVPNYYAPPAPPQNPGRPRMFL